MRVVQFCTSFLPGGGIQIHVRDLTMCLRDQGHEVCFAGEPGAALDGEPESNVIPLPLDEVSNPGGFILSRVAGAVIAAWKLRGEIRKRGIDLIHVHETAPAIVARIATFGLNVPVAMTFHGADAARIDEVARVARNCADLVISPSHTTLGFLTDRGVDTGRARWIGLGVHDLPDVDPAEVKALRRRLLGSDDGVLIFSLSRIDWQKGLDVMIDVVKRVIEIRPDTVFVVAGGPGSQADKVDAWAAEAGVTDHIRFVGVTHEVALHLAASDIYLLTSRWEALPISIVEAFRGSLPVIATDCGGVKELVDDEVGRLCAIEDVEGLTAAVLELVQDEALRQRLGRNAHVRSSEDRFSPEHVYTEFEGVYADLLKSSAS